jgi:PQQ-dependent catabolism-associated CXXCW motif protein
MIRRGIQVMLAWVCSGTLLTFAPAAQSADAVTHEPRLALVIGNSAYKIDPLRNPANDADDMARALQSLGFQVTLRKDATYRQMVEAINEFGRELKKGGIGLFYFAGHGVQSKGRNYLVPVNANVASEEELEFETVDAYRMLAVMDQAGNRVNIVILDACRNNPYARSFRSAARGLAQMDAAKGSYVAFATAPGSVAADGTGNNGLYTELLLKSLREPDTDIHKVFTRVTADVARVTGGKQVPWTASSLTGEFSFRPAQVAVAVPSATPVAPPVQFFAGEDRDFGVAPTNTPKRSPYHAPTPREIPGGKVIRTVELKQLLDSRSDVVVVDVLDLKESRATISGAAWMSGAGSAPFYAAEKARFAAAMARLTGGDKGKTVVFLCLNPECWLSYNASLHAIEAGYTNVHWFRGGTDAWRGAGYRTQTVSTSGW